MDALSFSHAAMPPKQPQIIPGLVDVLPLSLRQQNVRRSFWQSYHVRDIHCAQPSSVWIHTAPRDAQARGWHVTNRRSRTLSGQTTPPHLVCLVELKEVEGGSGAARKRLVGLVGPDRVAGNPHRSSECWPRTVARPLQQKWTRARILEILAMAMCMF